MEVKYLCVCDRDELDAAEYMETRSDTLDQLREFSESLSRMKEGNLSLVDDLNRIQLVSCLSGFLLTFFPSLTLQPLSWRSYGIKSSPHICLGNYPSGKSDKKQLRNN